MMKGALFPAGNNVRNSQPRKPPTRHKQVFNLDRILVQALLEGVM